MRTHDVEFFFFFLVFLRILFGFSLAVLRGYPRVYHDYGSTFIVRCRCTIVRAVVPSHPMELGRDLHLSRRISPRMHKDAPRNLQSVPMP